MKGDALFSIILFIVVIAIIVLLLVRNNRCGLDRMQMRNPLTVGTGEDDYNNSGIMDF